MALSPNGKFPRTNGRATAGRRTRGTRLTRSGLIGVLATALLWYGSLLIDSNLLLLLVGMFLGVLFASLRLAAGALDWIEVRRVVPETVAAGEPFTTRFYLRNTRRKRAFAIWVRQPLSDESRVRTADAFVPSIKPRSVQVLQQPGRALRRGIVALDTIELYTRFPFGLVEARRRIYQPQSLLVLPVLPAVRKMILRPRDQHAGTGSRVERHRSGVDDFLGLREYRTGDNPRWIHWRRSASMGQLVVREMSPFASASCTIVVDHRLSGPGDQDDRRRERAVSAAASLACHALEHGIQVGLIALAEWPVSIPAVGGKAHRAKILTELASMRGVPARELPEMLGEVRRRSFQGTQCVVFTSQRDRQTELLSARLRACGADVTVMTPMDDLFHEVFASPEDGSRPPRVTANTPNDALLHGRSPLSSGSSAAAYREGSAP